MINLPAAINPQRRKMTDDFIQDRDSLSDVASTLHWEQRNLSDCWHSYINPQTRHGCALNEIVVVCVFFNFLY